MYVKLYTYSYINIEGKAALCGSGCRTKRGKSKVDFFTGYNHFLFKLRFVSINRALFSHPHHLHLRSASCKPSSLSNTISKTRVRVCVRVAVCIFKEERKGKRKKSKKGKDK